jgi:uncharacterized membrane protein
MDIVAGQLETFGNSSIKKASHDFQDCKMKFKRFKKENPGLLKFSVRKAAQSFRKKIFRLRLARELKAIDKQVMSTLEKSQVRCAHSYKLTGFAE